MGKLGLKRRGGAGLAVVAGALVWAPGAFAAYDFKVNPFPTTDGFQTRSSFSCDSGDTAISGGVLGGGTYADGTYVTESYPGTTGGGPKQGWTGQIDNYGGGSASNQAYLTLACDTDGQHEYKRLHRANGLEVPDDSLRGETVMCDHGQTIVGGGADTALNAGYEDETYISMSGPVDGPDPDKIPDDGWRVEVNNDEDGDALASKYDLYAICDRTRPASAYRYVKATTKVNDGKQRQKSARCPEDERAIGGGIEVLAPYASSMLVSSTTRSESGDRTQWTGVVDNYNTNDDKARKFRVTAICKR